MRGTLNEAVKALARDPRLAAQLCRKLIDAEPHNRDARIVLVEALRREGRLEEALAQIEPLAKSDPNWFSAQRMHGLVLASRKEHRQAADVLARAAELNPEHAYIWREAGEQLRAAGDIEGSRQAYLNHIGRAQLDPRLIEASRALKENQPENARAALEPYLTQFANDPIALTMMAEVHAREDRPLEAEELLARVVDLVPGYLSARHSLGQLLMGLGQYDAALSVARDLANDDPVNVGPQKLLAAALGLVGEYKQASAIYRRLLFNDPDQPSIWLSLGHTLKTLGQSDEAIEAYRRGIALEGGLGDAYWSLANLKRFQFSDEDVANMERQVRSGTLEAAERVSMLFALGSAYEARRDAERAFEAYSQGARLHLAAQRSDPLSAVAPARARLQSAFRTFTPAFFQERSGFGLGAKDPIFIVGLPRAGSTLVEQILASHSQVEGTMELPDINAMAMRLEGAPQTEATFAKLSELNGDKLRELGESYLKTTRSHRKLGRAHFIDKMPNNFAHTALIHLILPSAKIVDVRRHPLACGWSCFKQHFAQGQLFTYDLAEIGRYYADYVALMAHFDAVLPGRIHRVIYERLVADPESEIRKLLDYCGLPFEEAVLSPHKTERPVHTASSVQVRQPISASGLDDWKPYERWLGPLKETLGPALEAYPDAP